MTDPLCAFDPAVSAWFRSTFKHPTSVQEQAWEAIGRGSHTLIAAPTGSGKTLAAFLFALDTLVRQSRLRALPTETGILYISPLKALSNDIEHNLQAPLAGIDAKLITEGQAESGIRAMVRSGDTPSRTREAMRRRPPHILITTPESLYILITSDSGRRMLSTIHTVIVDEIHALAGNKRGAHLCLSLERVAELTNTNLVRIGLSATQTPVAEVARFLVGTNHADPEQACAIIDIGPTRSRDLALVAPFAALEATMSAAVWEQIYTQLADLIRVHHTTLIFVNTRRMCERLTKHLSERIGEDRIGSHHGSLSHQQRHDAESRLQAGALDALVATASLELGIDIGEVDLVCQIGSTGSISTFLQRVGRSGHGLGQTPKGRLFPLSRDDLVECAALIDAVNREELDPITIASGALDVLAQQIVAMVAVNEWDELALLAVIRRAYPYRSLTEDTYDAVLRMLATGFATRRGRRGAYLHRDQMQARLRARRGAKLTAITCGGAIPDNANFDVLIEATGTLIGTLNEDFAIESIPGDIFQLGNHAWQILKIEPGKVRVANAHGQPPNLPFWLGEAPGRTDTLSLAVGRLKTRIAASLPAADADKRRRIAASLAPQIGADQALAEQLVDYLATAHAALGALPDPNTVVVERFFDDSGGMQLVLHTSFGIRINRAWGLTLRKRFCQVFNFELQAAASEDAIVLSLGERHSFELASIATYVRSGSVYNLLVQALIEAPMFMIRWRWNVNISLAVPRFRGGSKVAPIIQRMQAEDLLSIAFPDQIACAENLIGARTIPDHPLVQQTINDALTESMDSIGLATIIARIESGSLRIVSCDLTTPSPLAAEILSARPFAFLDDAPLEERRTRAVRSRRFLDPKDAAEIGHLNQEAIVRVGTQAWTIATTEDELYDALGVLGYLTAVEGISQSSWSPLLEALVAAGRATRFYNCPNQQPLWIAAQWLPVFRQLFPHRHAAPAVVIPAALSARTMTADDALVELLRARLTGVGVTTATAINCDLFLPLAAINTALLRLEATGFAIRGRFTAAATTDEWCERQLLAQIHRYTLQHLRREIEPIGAPDFMRFLLAWHGIGATAQGRGMYALERTMTQLTGYPGSVQAWNKELLPARVQDYSPELLDRLCLSGKIMWLRVLTAIPEQSLQTSLRSIPITWLQRTRTHPWIAERAPDAAVIAYLSATATRLLDYFDTVGASFLDDIAFDLDQPKFTIETALTELIATGLVHADGFGALHRLAAPKRQRSRRSSYITDSGRWSRFRPRPYPANDEHNLRAIGLGLLDRYGVIFKALLTREPLAPAWRQLLRVYHTLEARGDIRGGRFVDGFSGEQFARADAIPMLRDIRRQPDTGELIVIGAADPLNLSGVIVPGERIPSNARAHIAYCNGLPIAIHRGNDLQLLSELSREHERQLRCRFRVRCIHNTL